MSSIKVVDVNNEEAPQEEVAPAIEETAKEEIAPAVEEEPRSQIINEVVEQTNEEPKPKTEQKVKAQDKLITCPKCNKTMKTKSYRYTHERICQGNLTDRPVKPKAKPKPKPQQIIEETQPVINEVIEQKSEEGQKPKRIPRQVEVPALSPMEQMQQQFHFMQQEYMKQKQERYNNLFQGLMTGKSKKR